jgi:DNA-binding response OmpR family regulator
VVLVVEDEVWVLLDVAGELEEHGYAVLCAHNGAEALDLFEDRGDIGVVFTDINMPGSLCGLDLAREVRRRRPDVGLLVTSGRYREMEGDIPGGGIFIPKPYEPKIVIARIAGLIGAGIRPSAPCGQAQAPAPTRTVSPESG